MMDGSRIYDQENIQGMGSKNGEWVLSDFGPSRLEGYVAFLASKMSPLLEDACVGGRKVVHLVLLKNCCFSIDGSGVQRCDD